MKNASQPLQGFFLKFRLHASVILLCVISVSILWSGFFLHLNAERERIIDSKRLENDNLAKVFEEHVARTVRAAEITLQEIDAEYRRLGMAFDLQQYTRDRSIYLDPYNILSIADENGDLILSNTALMGRVSLRDTDSHQHHARDNTPDMFVSLPRKGSTTGKWTVYLTRRINKPDGSFGGMSAVGIDPGYFSRIYTGLELGKDSAVSVIGRDGIVRARNAGTNLTAGHNVTRSELFARLLDKAKHGSFIAKSPIDGVTRINSYRALSDYPLVVFIGTSQASALADFDIRRSFYGRTAAAMTLVILCLGLFALVQIMRSERERAARRAGEEALRSSEIRLKEAQRIARIGSWELDLRTRKLDWSDEIFRIFEIDKQKFAATYEVFLGSVHPQDRERVNAAYTESLSTRKPYDINHRLLMPDGRIKYVHERCESEFDEDNHPIRSIGTVQDITDLTLANEALAESHRLLEVIINTAPLRIFWKDRESRYLGCNRAFAVDAGKTHPDELIGKDDFDLNWKAEAELYRADDRKVMASGLPKLSYEEPQTTSKGHRIWVRTSKVPLRSSENHIIGILGIYEDITAVKAAESESHALREQLHQSQKMEAIGTLAGGIAHDFNNIIASIIGNTELARQDVGAGHPALVSLDEIGKASVRARSLIQQILAFSRKQSPEKRSIQLSAVVEEAVNLMRAALPAGIRLNFSCSDQALPAKVMADATQVHQAVINLCSNAAHACGNLQGRIDIQLDSINIDGAGSPAIAATPGRYLHVTVRDNGCGMDTATQAHIFDPFFTTKAAGEGTGLGLSVVHGIMLAHKGTVSVDSAPGKGSTFHLYFPVSDDAAAEAATKPLPQSPDGKPRHDQRIMYVDDDEALVFMLTRLLERQGYRVSGFVSPGEALEHLRANPNRFDVLITDYNMPELSGLDLARAVLAARPDLPVVLVSGYINDDLRRKSFDAGITRIIYKPDTVDELCDAVNDVISS